jgi:hypothetical protein
MSDSDRGHESSRRHAGRRGYRLTLLRLTTMGFAAVALYLLTRGFLSSRCGFLFFLVSLVAWPIWSAEGPCCPA